MPDEQETGSRAVAIYPFGKIVGLFFTFCVAAGFVGMGVWFAIWAWRGAIAAMGI